MQKQSHNIDFHYQKENTKDNKPVFSNNVTM